MHEHPLGVQLVIDGIEDVHAVDDHIFAAYCLINRGPLHIRVPFGIGLDVQQRLNKRLYLDGHGDIDLDEVWRLLFVVDLHRLADPLQPALLEDGELLARQVAALRHHLLGRQDVALLAELNPDHVHQRLHISQLIIFVHLFVNVPTVLDGRRALAYLELLLEVLVFGGDLVFAVGVEAVPLLVDFVGLQGLFVLVDDAEALLAFLQLEGVVKDLLGDDFLLQAGFFLPWDEGFGAFEHSKHRLALLLGPAYRLLCEELLDLLVLFLPLLREEVEGVDEPLLHFLVALRPNGLQFLDLGLLLDGRIPEDVIAVGEIVLMVGELVVLHLQEGLHEVAALAAILQIAFHHQLGQVDVLH